MGSVTTIFRAIYLLALAPLLLAVSACAQQTDIAGIPFDVPAQPAAAALNEFARQADIALIFSYDLVADERTHALKGRYAVDHGLTRLLEDTQLAYQRAADGTYFICPRDTCGQLSGAREEASPVDRKTNAAAGSGNSS